eukprot:scaffold71725_cov84-Phaeocystis_antarctica.AAC.5
MPKPQTRDDDHALSLTVARGKSPPMPSAFDWPATMNVGMHFDEQSLVCSARLPSRLVEVVVTIESACVVSACVATLMLAT